MPARAPCFNHGIGLCLLTCFAAVLQTLATVSDDAQRAPGGAGCDLETAGYKPGIHEVEFIADGRQRKFTFFVPKAYKSQTKTPFWLMGPGAFETPWRFLHVTGMVAFAEAKGLAFAVLEGTNIEGLNVGLHGAALPHIADDVSYTRAILRHVSAKMCINTQRIRCVGYSRGARFCSRLASELSNFVTGIAPVGGIRFPLPNNASRHMPIIAFHGSKDLINPYWGNGDPSYWNQSVPDAVAGWAAHNGCKFQRWRNLTKHILLNEHFDCKDDAGVVLVMIVGDGHTWAGSYGFVDAQFGDTTKEQNATEIIWNFFGNHPVRARCHTPLPWEICHQAVMKAMRDGLPSHEEDVGSITNASTFAEIQSVLHYGILADCAAPCAGEEAELVYMGSDGAGTPMKDSPMSFSGITSTLKSVFGYSMVVKPLSRNNILSHAGVGVVVCFGLFVVTSISGYMLSYRCRSYREISSQSDRAMSSQFQLLHQHPGSVDVYSVAV